MEYDEEKYFFKNSFSNFSALSVMMFLIEILLKRIFSSNQEKEKTFHKALYLFF